MPKSETPREDLMSEATDQVRDLAPIDLAEPK
jgi:hypothetical protein